MPAILRSKFFCDLKENGNLVGLPEDIFDSRQFKESGIFWNIYEESYFWVLFSLYNPKKYRFVPASWKLDRQFPTTEVIAIRYHS